MRRNLLEEFLAGSLAYCQNDVCADRRCQPASHSQAKVDFFWVINSQSGRNTAKENGIVQRYRMFYLFIFY